jgi:signal transduction histidine kinase
MTTPLRVLYLEDEPDDAELVQETLAADGLACDVVRVETRAAFAAALDQGGWDLIFSEKTLPALDGLSALALARAQLPAVPFIFVSGTLDEEVAIESLKNGATDYVLKQRLTRLVPVTRRALREAAQRRERQRAEEQVGVQYQRLLELNAELELHNQQRKQLMGQLLLAQEQERKRIARDIHDGPLQDLGVLLLTSELCKRQLLTGNTDQASLVLDQLRHEIRQTLDMLRTLLTDLRPGILDTLGLRGALDYLAGQAGRDSNLVIEIHNRIDERLDPLVEVVVFRMVQESLTNIRKHAQAQHTWITLERQEDRLYLEMRDDGQGFAVAARLPAAHLTGHMGLVGMQERVESIGGQLTIQSTAGEGTVLGMTLPYLSAGLASG